MYQMMGIQLSDKVVFVLRCVSRSAAVMAISPSITLEFFTLHVGTCFKKNFFFDEIFCRFHLIPELFLLFHLQNTIFHDTLVKRSYRDRTILMELDLTGTLTKVQSAWNNINFYRSSNKGFFYLSGPKGCGKTKTAQAYVHAHAYAFYFSFDQLSYVDAVRYFSDLFLARDNNPLNMTEALNAFLFERRKRPTLIFLEEEENDAMRECRDILLETVRNIPTVRLCLLETTQEPPLDNYSVWIGYLIPADFCNLFPRHSRSEAMRLYALTGGIPAIVKDLDETISYEENVRYLLRNDSAFSSLLPDWLCGYFRSPESYYPILSSIGSGRHRLSEIAKDIGFPNNKCGKYLEALIRHGFVSAEKAYDEKQATYHLANSYIAAWCRYARGKKMLQIADPDKHFRELTEDIDERLALSAFHDACFRYLSSADRSYLSDFRYSKSSEISKNVTITLGDGSTVLLDLCISKNGSNLICVFPHRLEMRYTKEELQRILTAVDRYVSTFNTDIIIFSLERFSDWCVHQAAIRDELHEVTVERLRY